MKCGVLQAGSDEHRRWNHLAMAAELGSDDMWRAIQAATVSQVNQTWDAYCGVHPHGGSFQTDEWIAYRLASAESRLVAAVIRYRKAERAAHIRDLERERLETIPQGD